MDFPRVTVPEENSCNLVGVVREYKDGPAIGSASISAATVQINNYDNDAEIRAETSITADIDVDGNMDHVITTAENEMIDDTKNWEYHIVTIRITGTSGDAKTVNIVQSVALKVTQNLFEMS